MNPKQYRLRTLLALLILCSTPALADDRSQPIHIQSDSAQIDQRQGITVYEGTVQLTQGSLKITADTVTIHTNSENQVQKLAARGQPARLQQQPDPTKATVYASADAIDYDVHSEQVLLVTNANLEQDGATMTGNRIDYNIAQDIVKVSGEAGTDRPRIEMVIPPSNRNTED